MCAKETSFRVQAQQASVEMIADLLLTAEREVASFYEAIEKKYGPEEARKAACDWIEEVETMNWPAEGTIPNWRHVSIVAVDCLASRVIERPPNL
jgi:hypothetical protein